MVISVVLIEPAVFGSDIFLKGSSLLNPLSGFSPTL